jgi:hypothetical protein
MYVHTHAHTHKYTYTHDTRGACAITNAGSCYLTTVLQREIFFFIHAILVLH